MNSIGDILGQFESASMTCGPVSFYDYVLKSDESVCDLPGQLDTVPIFCNNDYFPCVETRYDASAADDGGRIYLSEGT